MKENMKNVILILAIVISVVSLPIGIIGFAKKPIVNYYYTENYYNEPSEEHKNLYPLEIHTFVNISSNTFFFERILNMSENNVLYMASNLTYVRVYIVRDSMFEYFNISEPFGEHTEYFSLSDAQTWIPTHNTIWHLFFWKSITSETDITIFIEVN